jgi:hypothetical protein
VVRKDTKMNDAQVRIVDGFDITLQIWRLKMATMKATTTST